MPRSQRKPTIARRDVLRAMVAGVGASAVPLASSVEAAESTDDKRKARYRLSDHVKAYYRVNHYPSK
ncbi:MAG: formate dehydrogenase [Bradyrhizobiaceae bacterium]|nr:formate dehydrogenase [Hyphomicrobiales bacterium]MBV9428937.1 formate dehydrogenase [Bradyrhizobiaceae bacterium]